MANMEIVPASAAQIREFFGEKPKQTVRAWLVMIDGAPVALGGFAYSGDYIVMFSDLKPDIRRYRKSIVKAAKQIVREATSRHNGAVIALADPNEPTAPSFLTHLGFLYAGSSPDGEVYQWLS